MARKKVHKNSTGGSLLGRNSNGSNKTGLYLVFIVAIVAVVGLVLMFTGKSSDSSDSTLCVDGEPVNIVDEEGNVIVSLESSDEIVLDKEGNIVTILEKAEVGEDDALAGQGWLSRRKAKKEVIKWMEKRGYFD